MAKKLQILIFPDPRLRKIAEKITKFDKSLQNLADDMLLTMYDANGIGLAATQVNRHVRLVVMDISDNRDDPRIFVNPSYRVLKDHNLFEFEEGCLSIPGFNETIARPDRIELIWQDISGKEHSDSPEGLLTVCIQHEIDHLDGKLMVDYVSALKRDRVRSKLLKEYS
ncbi:MAG: peptide deformylase [SAR86 cluster bacterium]|jgi:peptide deformylase|uniref:Peptide deformylase n=1 Tax=SAR86 cluster bacterium TaxID=2030880 RepID=A0A520MV66_9GAMM|nr:MAG: peptide deformylase [SAR86 cluster bacterium]|tara:strand:+ start:146 stop:649 length:504 start_codon:yes stop_codon:yes gene_type:complete